MKEATTTTAIDLDTAAHAARAIRDSGCGCAPVIEDTENLKLVGVVTERDVCCSVAADDRHASEVRVEEIMRPSSACCDADESVEETRRKLLEHRATSLPVVDRRAVAAAQSACTVWRGRRKRGAITQEVIDILAVLNARCGPHFLPK